MSELKREWFEPGPDGEIPFVKAALNTTAELPVWETIAAAFRALLAEEQAAPVVHVDLSSQPDVTRAVQLDEHGNILQEVGVTHDGEQVLSVQPAPPALQVGDLVRLENFNELCHEQAVAIQATITGVFEDGTITYTSSFGNNWWPASACTLIRRAGEVQSVDTQRSIAAALANGQLSLQDEIVGLRAEVEQHDERDALINQLRAEVEELKEHIKQRRDFESQRDLEYAHWQNVEVPDIHERMQDAEAERDAARAELATITKSRAHYENLYNESQAELGKARPNVEFLKGQVEIVEARNAELRAEVKRLDKWRVAMNGLTPNGSEYVQDLDRCVSVIRERFQSGHEAKKALVRVTAERDALQEQVEAWQDATGLVGIYSDGSEGDPGDVTPEMLSKHLDELRSKASELDKVLAVLMEAHLDPDVASMAQIGIPSQVANWITVCQILRTRADALQARIDAGARVYRCKNSVWWGAHFDDYGDTALLIDARPIDQADHIVEPNKMADERKAERRKDDITAIWNGSKWLYLRDDGQHHKPSRDNNQNRRRTPGTRADRKAEQ